MPRSPYPAFLLIAVLAILPATAETQLPEFMEEAGPALEVRDPSCPGAGTVPWVETGQFSTCAGLDADFKQFKKRWRRLLNNSPSFRADPKGGWDKMSTGIRTNLFRYQGLPGTVYFDEEQGRAFFTVRITISACPGADPKLPGPNETVYRIGSPGVIKPEKALSVNPGFPTSLQKSRSGGTVILRAIIDTDGVPDRLCVLEADPNNQDMKDSALDAVRLWRYDPALKDDTPVPFYLTIQVNFEIQ